MSNDVLILGRAKTGTTFLAQSVAQSLGAAYVSEPKTREAAMISAGVKTRVVKVIFEHWAPDELRALLSEDQFTARLAILRDPRDEYVSRALFMARAELWSGRAGKAEMEAWACALEAKERSPVSISFHELMRGYSEIFKDAAGAPGFGQFAQDTDRYLEFVETAPCTSVRYEKFVDGDFSEITDATGAPITGAHDLGDQWYTKRSSGSGDWRRLFTEDDLSLLKEKLSGVVERAGYEDWTLDPAPVLAAEHYSGYVRTLWKQFSTRPGGWRVRLKRALKRR